MKKTKFKQLIVLFAFLGFTASISSCNRGYGCPTNFSMNETVVKVVTMVAHTLVIQE